MTTNENGEPAAKRGRPRSKKAKEAMGPQEQWSPELEENAHFRAMSPLWKQFYEAVRRGARDE